MFRHLSKPIWNLSLGTGLTLVETKIRGRSWQREQEGAIDFGWVVLVQFIFLSKARVSGKSFRHEPATIAVV